MLARGGPDLGMADVSILTKTPRSLGQMVVSERDFSPTQHQVFLGSNKYMQV